MWTIRNDQLRSLADKALAGVVKRAAGALAEAVPELPKTLGRERFDGWVNDLVKSGVASKILSEENLQRYVSWHAVLGYGHKLLDRYPIAKTVLDLVDEREEVRMAAVEKLVDKVLPGFSAAVAKVVERVYGVAKGLASKVGVKLGDPCIPCIEQKINEAGRKQVAKLARQGSEALDREATKLASRVERQLAGGLQRLAGEGG